MTAAGHGPWVVAVTLAWSVACAADPTFTDDVAPILAQHCVGCHQPGQSAPFSLVTYADVKGRADAIAAAISERRMPPWLPDRGRPAFEGERGLRDDQVALIQHWIAEGTPRGDLRDHAPAPVHRSPWQLGAPDLVASPPTPYLLPPAGHDVYRNLVIRLALPAARFVRAIEFLPGEAPIHHAVIRVDRQRLSRAHDGTDGQPGFDGMAAHEVQDPEGHFLGWAPGRGPIVAPETLPWALDRDSDLVVEVHLMPGANPVPVQPRVGLYFTDRAPTASPVMIVMGSKAIDIPPGARDYAIEDRYELPVAAELQSVYPHAHYLGREMDVRALLPDGSSQPLIHIRQWSFNWQQDYRFVTPVSLPRGTTIVMRYTYDNSADNRHNPHRPPRRVTWGPQSHDEMGNLGLQLVTRTRDEAAALAQSFAHHAALIDIAGAEALVATAPDDAAHLAMLGTSYASVGRFDDAIRALERSLRSAASATNENHLAGALLGAGRGGEALVHFRRASALAPRDAHLHFNLAKVLASAGQPREALDHYRQALALRPDFAEAHHHAGVVLFAAGRVSEALGHLRQAADLLPSSAAIHADLGGALAEAGRLDEAARHLARAVELDPANDTARQNLALLARIRPR